MSPDCPRVLKTIYSDKKDVIEGYSSQIDISIICVIELTKRNTNKPNPDILLNVLNDFLRVGLYGFENLQYLDCQLCDSETFSSLKKFYSNDESLLHNFFPSYSPCSFPLEAKYLNYYLLIRDNLEDIVDEVLLNGELKARNMKYRFEIATRLDRLLEEFDNILYDNNYRELEEMDYIQANKRR